MLFPPPRRTLVQLHLFAVCLLVAVDRPCAAPFADAVVDYDPGVGYAEEYGTGLGYTLTDSVLGSPNSDNGFGELQPFNPAFSRQDLLSIGEGGHLTVHFDSPLLNHTDSYYGMDFILYGSSGFIDVDYPNGIADGSASLFGQTFGQTQVSVSSDNVTYYLLDPSRAPLVDAYFPTDSQGQYGQPMDPTLNPADFADLNLDQIRGLYGGSAGGTAFDLAWAIDSGGGAINVDEVSYVRIDVLTGRSEIDAMAMVVPEPGTISLLAMASVVGLLWSRRHYSQKRAK